MIWNWTKITTAQTPLHQKKYSAEIAFPSFVLFFFAVVFFLLQLLSITKSQYIAEFQNMVGTERQQHLAQIDIAGSMFWGQGGW
jgi:hypothetical protein